MFFLIKKINKLGIKILYKKYNIKIKKLNIFLNKNKKFGDITIIIKSKILNFYNFFLKKIKKRYKKYIKNIIIIKNYFNIFLNNYFYIRKILFLNKKKIKKIFFPKKIKKEIIIEFASPNSNKPLHIGHLRNILIGNTLANIFTFIGYKVIKSQIINDRGRHICKNIVYWKFFNKKKIPKKKSDHFIGKLYYKFEKKLQEEKKILKKKKKKSKLLKLVKNELIKWEKKNKNTIKIWKIFRNLILKGFKKIYKKLNIKFNNILYESKIYLLGKKKIKKFLKKGIFLKYKKKSIIFLYKKKKIYLLRKDGTSLYITQDIGIFFYRLKKYKNFNLLIYVVGNEQIEYFKILFNIFFKIINFKKKIFHLSYNSVNFLGKKIKSRYKKNIIFIDDLIEYVNKFVKKKFTKVKNIELITLGSIKYQFIKINPKKILNFNLENILNLKGNTGIYIQYTYARIYKIKKKNKKKIKNIKIKKYINIIKNNEIEIIKYILEYKEIINKVILNYDISILTNYIFLISKKINNFYQKNKILNIENIYKKNFRIIICNIILKFLYINMKILGIPILKKI